MIVAEQVAMRRGLLPLLSMKPTSLARQQIERLLKFGVAQKVIAAKLGVSEATFSRWYRGQPDSRGNLAKIPAEALDRLQAYVEEMVAALDSNRAVPQIELQETQRSAAAAAETIPATAATGTAGGLQENKAPSSGKPERRHVG